MAILIIVNPSPKRNDNDTHHTGRFDARLEDRIIVKRSRTPFCDAARKLLAEGFSPDEFLVMRHAGSGRDALRASLGVAGALSVAEETSDGKPRLVKWRAHPHAQGNVPQKNGGNKIPST